MSVPGVNVTTAATFMAAIGEVSLFRSPRRLVGYLGLDPRLRQSGEQAFPILKESYDKREEFRFSFGTRF